MTTLPNIAAAPRIVKRRGPNKAWLDVPPALPRDHQAWAKRKRKPLPALQLAEKEKRAEQAKRAAKILREVSAIRRKLDPIPPREMGRVRGLPAPAQKNPAMIARERAGRRADMLKRRHAALGFTP